LTYARTLKNMKATIDLDGDTILRKINSPIIKDIIVREKNN